LINFLYICKIKLR